MLVRLDLAAGSRDFLLIGAGYGTQAVVQRRSDRSVRVIVSEGSRGRGTLFRAKAYQLGAETDELVDAPCQLIDVGLLRGDGVGLPRPRDILKLAELANEILREGLCCPPICGHVDAARLHDDR